MLSQIPSFTISRIAVSPKGQKLLLWGDHGIAVVDIPRRRRANGVTTCRYANCRCQFLHIRPSEWSNHPFNVGISMST